MKKVRTLYGLYDAALNKKSIICPDYPPWKKPCPAAFILHLQGSVILSLFKHGMYIYQKEGYNVRKSISKNP